MLFQHILPFLVAHRSGHAWVRRLAPLNQTILCQAADEARVFDNDVVISCIAYHFGLQLGCAGTCTFWFRVALQANPGHMLRCPLGLAVMVAFQ